MPNADVPRLCGGTFLTQILRTKKPPTKTKAEGLQGAKDSVNNQRVLETLIQFFDPKFFSTYDKTFKGDVSAYLSCKKIEGTNLPFTKKYYGDKVPKFDTLIKSNYNEPLRLMENFVETYINTGEGNNIQSVVCALLQTIIDDVSINDDQLFLMGAMGLLTKESLKNETNIILECFLLGIWHFIITNRENNTIGRNTYLEWTESQGTGKQRLYTSHIGSEIQDIKVSRSNGIELQSEAKEEKNAEYIEEDTEEYVSDGYVSPALRDYQALFQQIIINPVINNFNGVAGSTQVQYNNGVIVVSGMQPTTPAVPSLPDKPEIDKEDYYHLVIGYEYGKRVIVMKDRSLNEYISDDVKRTFSLTNTKDMEGIPVLIMPEINDSTHEQTAITGRLTKVKDQDNGVVLYLQKGFSFPSSIITSHMNLFGISHIFELNRTHWTIKKINLQEAMEDAGVDL